MCTFLKELFFGQDPKFSDPYVGSKIIKVSDTVRESLRLERYVSKRTNNNKSLFRKIPEIKKNKNILYFFSLNYSPTKVDLEREYLYRNLEPANPNLLLKYFLDHRKSFKKHSPALSFFKAKKSINYSALLVYPDKINIRIYSEQLDKNNCFDKSFYFYGTKRNIFQRFLDFFSSLTAF